METATRQVGQQVLRGTAVAAHPGGTSGAHATTPIVQLDLTFVSRAAPPVC